MSLPRLRWASGLVLLAYVLTHFANHALGLVSLQAQEIGRGWFLALWRHPLGTTLLYGALVLHLGLALWSLYARPSLRQPALATVQLVLGLAVPPLLAIHVIGTRLAEILFDTNDNYAYVLLVLWVFAPWQGVRQGAALLAAWGHVSIGLRYRLRLRPWYPRARAWLAAVAVAVPLLALLGFVAAGREVERLYQDPAWRAAAEGAIRFAAPEGVALLYRLETWVLAGYAGALVAVLAARRRRNHGRSGPC
jgi:adenylate cyclase